MLRLLIAAGIAIPVFSSPAVTYSISAGQAAGITVTHGADPGFNAALQPFLANPLSKLDLASLASLRPYALIIRNTATKPIAAISLRWERKYPGGMANHSTMVLDCRQTTEREAQFLPGQSYLAIPGNSTIGANVGILSPASASHFAQKFNSASSVDVILDAVIFGGGQLAGPDTGGMAVQYETERQAIADVMLSLQNRKTAYLIRITFRR